MLEYLDISFVILYYLINSLYANICVFGSFCVVVKPPHS